MLLSANITKSIYVLLPYASRFPRFSIINSQDFQLHPHLKSAIFAPMMNVEKHPFQPFLPEGARILFLGSFPPQPHRWCMPFYYPNWINDFWRVTGNE